MEPGNTWQETAQVEKIATSTCTSWLDEDGILWVISHPHSVETIETAKDNVVAGLKLSAGIRRPLLFDMSRIKSMDKEARDDYARTEKRESWEKAAAIIIKSPVSKVMGNFFLGLNKPSEPVKLFTDREKAIAWLRNYI